MSQSRPIARLRSRLREGTRLTTRVCVPICYAAKTLAKAAQAREGRPPTVYRLPASTPRTSVSTEGCELTSCLNRYGRNLSWHTVTSLFERTASISGDEAGTHPIAAALAILGLDTYVSPIDVPNPHHSEQVSHRFMAHSARELLSRRSAYSLRYILFFFFVSPSAPSSKASSVPCIARPAATGTAPATLVENARTPRLSLAANFFLSSGVCSCLNVFALSMKRPVATLPGR